MNSKSFSKFFKSAKWNRIKSVATILLFVIMVYFGAKMDFYNQENLIAITPGLFMNYPGLKEMIPKAFFGIIGILFTKLWPSIQNLQDNEEWKVSQRQLQRSGLLKKDTKIRISFAYLFRIKVDGKYLLVPNARTGKFQPVGGAYKFEDEERKYLDDEFAAEDDDCILVNETTRNDYRLNIKNKYLRDFIKRFNDTKSRENITDLSREFKEELIKTDILDKIIFEEIKYRYIGRHMTEIIRTSFKPYELLLADIVELELSKKQEEYLKKMSINKSDKYIFANSLQIKSQGMEIGTENLQDNIANHTWKILTENTDKLIKKRDNQEFFVNL
ncbi:hypothetical protein [Dialister micraerophilus]|uniref:SMODS-associated NUDIX domain-containing protein n=1 Tax=Dialister micraerophilus TaxID=309120 RepID=UPI0023F3211A|nr:hypothetical protein [Dialister micraerophilus]